MSIYRDDKADFMLVEEFLKKFLHDMALEITDGNVNIPVNSIDYVSAEHLTNWASQLADEINGHQTFTIHGEKYELASFSEPYSDGSRHATIRVAA